MEWGFKNFYASCVFLEYRNTLSYQPVAFFCRNRTTLPVKVGGLQSNPPTAILSLGTGSRSRYLRSLALSVSKITGAVCWGWNPQQTADERTLCVLSSAVGIFDTDSWREDAERLPDVYGCPVRPLREPSQAEQRLYVNSFKTALCPERA